MWSLRNVLLLSLVLPAVILAQEQAQEQQETETAQHEQPQEVTQQDGTQEAEQAQETAETQQQEQSTFNAKEHTDWGSYYDPKNVFCGQYDCYAILGFDFESTVVPNKKEITKRYRSLSREWHPDKSKHKHAKEKFVKIARAYEVLTDEEQRMEYDYMRYNQEAYFQKYGSSVLWEYAPKSDAVGVVVFLLAVGSALSWLVQKQKWQNVANRLVDAAVEDLGPREGGTPESKALRERAMDILSQREKAQQDNNGTLSPEKKKKKQKLTPTEKRKQLQDQLRPIITDLVEESHDDFGAGFHKPTWRDLLVVKVVKFPYYFWSGVTWNTRYFVRRLLKKDLSEEEVQVLTTRAVGDIAWHSASPQERDDMMSRKLWISANMLDWEEDQEIKQLSPSEQKRYNRWKKKGKKIDWSKEE